MKLPGFRPRRILVIVCTSAILALSAIAAEAAGPFDATYVGGAINDYGYIKLKTGGTGDVSYYETEWQRKICGIRDFSIWFSTLSPADEIPVDATGHFSESFTFTYRKSGRKYRVRAANRGYFGTYAQMEGQTNDQVYMKTTVRVKPIKRGAKWCGPKTHEFLGMRQ